MLQLTSVISIRYVDEMTVFITFYFLLLGRKVSSRSLVFYFCKEFWFWGYICEAKQFSKFATFARTSLDAERKVCLTAFHRITMLRIEWSHFINVAFIYKARADSIVNKADFMASCHEQISCSFFLQKKPVLKRKLHH